MSLGRANLKEVAVSQRTEGQKQGGGGLEDSPYLYAGVLH
jgi:hypothetical protein